MLKDIYDRIKKMLDMVEETVGYIKNFNEDGYEQLAVDLTADLKYTMEVVNQELLDSPKVGFCDLDRSTQEISSWKYREQMIEQCTIWTNTIRCILEKRYHAENFWDEKFIRLMDYVGYVDYDSIVQNAKRSLMKHDVKDIGDLCTYYQCFQELWGTLDVLNGRYDVIEKRVKALKEHREDFIWLYERLDDWRSRLVLISMLYSWITFDMNYITRMKEANFTDYFDLDIVKCSEKEVVVDLGAWKGDSALNYIQTYGRYKRIYCYEIDKTSLEEMKKNLCPYPDIEYRNKGVGNKNGEGYMAVMGEGSTGNKLVDRDTGEKIELVTLDDDIHEKITLIKMDIEGAEQAALSGCIRHIQEERPKLLISVYHNNEDIWKIPRMVTDMVPDYRLYLRSNGNQWGPSEIVLFAIDNEEHHREQGL